MRCKHAARVCGMKQVNREREKIGKRPLRLRGWVTACTICWEVI